MAKRPTKTPAKARTQPAPEAKAWAGVFSRHSPQKDQLIPVLQDIQSVCGWIPREAMKDTARFLNVPESAVHGVATFYAQFYLTRQGKHRIKVCRGTACHVRGSSRIMRAVMKKLGIKPGETTPDYRFSLERVACFGSCALAPVMVVDGKVHGRMTPQRAEEILRQIGKARSQAGRRRRVAD